MPEPLRVVLAVLLSVWWLPSLPIITVCQKLCNCQATGYWRHDAPFVSDTPCYPALGATRELTLSKGDSDHPAPRLRSAEYVGHCLLENEIEILLLKDQLSRRPLNEEIAVIYLCSRFWF